MNLKALGLGLDHLPAQGDETGQGEPMSQSPPRSSGRGSEETVSMPRKRKKPKDHNKEGRQLYYKRCSWCTARPRDHSQLCCAPTGTECPDLSSYQAATEIWWRSENALHSNTSRHSGRRKKKTRSFPLAGRPRQVSFDHQKMPRLEEIIEKAALAI